MTPLRRWRPGRRAGSALTLVAALAVAACTDQGAVGGTQRAIDIYGSVLTWMINEELPPPADPAGPGTIASDDEVAEAVEPPTVYVENLGPEIGLQVQVELVAHFEEQGYQLRFLDERSEAIDEADPQLPVRRGGLLVGLGPIPEGRRVDVRAEVYRDTSDLSAYRFTLARSGDAWTMVEVPTPVDPEGFVAAP